MSHVTLTFDPTRVVRHGTPDMTATPNPRHDRDRSTLWVDGVGAYLVRFGDRLSIGGPVGDTDLVLLANLSRHHAEIVRHGEGYVLEPHARCRVEGRDVTERTLLADGHVIELNEGVKLRFRQPSVLSTTARIEFASDHRPDWSVDGVLLVQETLLLGPGDQNHVVCREWPESVILTRRNDVTTCRSRTSLVVGTDPVQGEATVPHGATVTGPGMRFRLE